MSILENKNKVFDDVAKSCEKYSRATEDVTVIAVTKYVDSDIALQVIETGVKDIAENRVDKFLDKYQALSEHELTWHLIGTLQRRKVKDVINYVDYFHALDSVKLAKEINKRANHVIKCFLQVNISGEESKHGFTSEEAEEVLKEMAELENIEIVGLMTMAPFEASAEECDNIFKKTNELKNDLSKLNQKNASLTELSMGMSGDYDAAIKNGATYVRIGSSFFK